MLDYESLRKIAGHPVSQTLDAPITVFDIWELTDVFVALAMILIFGILFYEWALLVVLLSVTLIGLPYVRKTYPKGMVFHYPYRRFGMELPGLFNPYGRPVMSD